MLVYLVIYSLLLGKIAQSHLPIKQPAFITLPTVIKSEENETIFIPCLIENLGNSYIRWWKDQTLLYDSSTLISTSEKYAVLQDGMSIDSVKAEDAGEYSCEVVRPQPWSSFKLTQVVEIMYPPKIFTTPSNGYLEVVLGEKVQIGCSATGVPPPVISWRANNKVINFLEENIQKLEFTASNPLLSGIYQCEASNGIGFPVHTNIILRILHPPEIETDKTWVHSAPGIKTIITCRISAEPQPQVEWLYNDQIFQSSSPRIIQQTRENESFIIFNSVTVLDFGNYTCVASNKLGIAARSIELSGVANPAVFKLVQRKPPDSYTLIWEVDSYSPIFEYKLLFRKEYDLEWVSFIIPANSFPSGPLHTKSYTIYGLNRLTLYEAKIFSRNRFGWSNSSNIVKFGYTKSIDIKGDEVKNDVVRSSSQISSAGLKIMSNDNLNKIPILLLIFKFFQNIYDTS